MTTKRPDDRAKRLGDTVRWILAAWPTLAAKVDVEAMTLVWGMALMDLDPDDVQAAVVELSKTERYFTSIADIRARVVARHHGEARIGIEAWGDVTRELKRVGRYGRPVFHDPAIAIVLADVGGWSAVCDMTNGEVMSMRSRFCERYDQLAGQMRKSVQLSPGAKMRSLTRAEATQSLGGIVRGLLTTTRTEDEDDDDSE